MFMEKIIIEYTKDDDDTYGGITLSNGELDEHDRLVKVFIPFSQIKIVCDEIKRLCVENKYNKRSRDNAQEKNSRLRKRKTGQGGGLAEGGEYDWTKAEGN